MNRLRGLLARLALAAAAALFALLAAECILRLTLGGWLWYSEPRLESGRWTYLPDQTTRFTHPEWDVVIATNSQGLRDEAGCPKRGPGDVVMLGDSFVEGHGVALEATVAKRLEAQLAVHVHNAGHYGAQTAQYAGTYRGVFQKVPHARVLVGFYIGNDFVTPGEPDRFQPPDRTGLGYRVRAALSDRSALYNWLRFQVRRSPPLFWLMGKLGLMTFIPAFPEPAVHDAGWMPERIAFTAKLLGDLKREAEAAGKRLEVFVIPTREQVEDARWKRLVAEGQVADGARFALNDAFVAALAKEGVKALDLGQSFALADRAGERLYFTADRHWTPAGHARAADELFKAFGPY